MKPPQDINIQIPADIAALPDLNLIEKAVLNRIHERSDCSNPGLAKLTGLSVRGAESTLARLRNLGLIRSSGKGRSRRLWLTFHVERHTGCGENVNAECHTGCGKNQNENTHMECGVDWNSESHTTSGVGTEKSIPDISDDPAKVVQIEKRHSDALFGCLLVGAFNQARLHLDCLRQCVAKLAQVAPEMKERNDRVIQTYDNFIFILEAGGECIERRDERVRLMTLLFEAGPERLLEIRQQIGAAKARGERIDLKRLLEG